MVSPAVFLLFAFICLIALLIQFFIARAIANAAERKGRSWAAFFWLSFLVNWVVMAIVVAAISNQPNRRHNNDAKENDLGSTPVQCPRCKESIRADAVGCKYCGVDVEPQLPRLQNELREAKSAEQEAAFAEKIKLEQMRTAASKAKLEAAEIRKAKLKKVISSPKVFVPLLVIFVGVPLFLVIQQQVKSSMANDWENRVPECSEYLTDGTSYTINEGNNSINIQYSRFPTKWLDCLGEKIVQNPPEKPLSAAIALKVLNTYGNVHTVWIKSERKLRLTSETP